MIQKTSSSTNPPHASVPLVPFQHTTADGATSWGQWSGRKHYELQVVQHPLRARMCGFGDKDRRPLAPAAVAKMTVRREDNSLVDIDDIDCSFFLVTVDLWSADAQHEMNLVLHPAVSDRYVPPQNTRPRRRGTGATASSQRTAPKSPSSSNSTPNSAQQPARLPADCQAPSAPAIQQGFPSGYVNHGYSFSSQPPTIQDPMSSSSSASYSCGADPYAPWGYPQQAPPVDRNGNYPPTAAASINSMGRNTSPNSIDSDPSFRSWNADPSYAAMENVSPNAVNAYSNADDPYNQQQLRYPQDSYTVPSSSYDPSVYSTVPYQQTTPQAPYTQGGFVQSPPPPPPVASTSSAAFSSPNGSPQHNNTLRHAYTRTLVGPLSANACRLVDEHHNPGIFFLFQDLSVRTEGTFRLRLRLMNVGAPPAPESGAVRVHNDMSPVLAQTFTEPFVVYSAKRFPGVPETTPLSIALGNQGQKLPLRNRHGTSKNGRRRHREDDSDGSGESDES